MASLVTSEDEEEIPTSIKSRNRKLRRYSGDSETIKYKTPNPSESCKEQRIEEFPDESLALVDGNLKCVACGRVFSLWKKALIRQHVKTDSHNENLAELHKKQKQTEASRSQIKQYEEKEMLQGCKSVDLDAKLLRQEVCSVFLECMIPLSKLEPSPRCAPISTFQIGWKAGRCRVDPIHIGRRAKKSKE